MPAADARQWFGRVPPDLSLTARERGASWIYTYLNSFYADPKRPFGANNFLVPDVAMPNVLVSLRDNSGMTQQQFEQSLTDVVSFLSYVAEPEKAMRHTLGWKVLLFLLVLLIVVFSAKRSPISKKE
jgi:ubiquinol-cytochrome c reductase cytochrome c1 subunit